MSIKSAPVQADTSANIMQLSPNSIGKISDDALRIISSKIPDIIGITVLPIP